MYSVYLHSEAGGHAPLDAPAHEGTPDLLREVLALTGNWLQRLPCDNYTRNAVLHLEALTQNLLECGSISARALSNLRALLCVSCRHLRASPSNCNGRPVAQCPLLLEMRHQDPRDCSSSSSG